jgi:hypothetical protein
MPGQRPMDQPEERQQDCREIEEYSKSFAANRPREAEDSAQIGLCLAGTAMIRLNTRAVHSVRADGAH